MNISKSGSDVLCQKSILSNVQKLDSYHLLHLFWSRPKAGHIFLGTDPFHRFDVPNMEI